MPRKKKIIKNPPHMPDELRAFGASLAKMREEAKVDRFALAAAVETSYQNIGHYESGRNWPSIPTLLKIRKHLTGEVGVLL